MKPVNLRRTVTLVAFACVVGLTVFYLVLNPKLISLKEIGNDGTVDAVFVGPKKYQNGFSKSIENAALFFDPYEMASELFEEGDYQGALAKLDESIRATHQKVAKAMAYNKMAQIYRKTGNLEKELKCVELDIQNTGNDTTKLKLEHRAAEIRQLLTAENQSQQSS